MILGKKQMTEEDIKLNYITPAINASGWKNGFNITMKTKITDGKINIKGNVASREKAKKVDGGTIAPPEGEGVSARTVSERGRQPRSLTDYEMSAEMLAELWFV